MARHTQHNDRKRGRTVVAASFAVAGLAITGAGVYAGLNATATGTQSVSSGTLKLVQLDAAGTGAGFGQTYNDMAPGDDANAYVQVRDTGTIEARNMTLRVTGAGTTLLTTDATKGLHITVQSCSVPWVAGVCADNILAVAGGGEGGGTVVVDDVPVATLATTPSTLVSGAVTKYAATPATAYHYKVTTSLPDQNETTTNGTLPGTTIQGLSTILTYTFDEAQRAGVTTES